MKKIIILFGLLVILFSKPVLSQCLFSYSIDSLKNLVSSENIKKYNRELSGDTLTSVNGKIIRLVSRKTTSPFNNIAGKYIYEKFSSFGLSTRYQVNDSSCINVIATKTGTRYPNQYFIICAHYDNYCSMPSDTIPGADDNASGICGVLETARLLANFNTDYTIKFIAFDEEEDWMIGSYAYVDSAYANGDSIAGVLNLDMIGNDPQNTNILKVVSNNASRSFASSFIAFSYIYQIPIIPLEVVSETSASDHLPFLDKGYKAMMGFEQTFSSHYHSTFDKFEFLNLPYLTNNIKASLVTLASWGTDRRIGIVHNPVSSGYDTSAKILTFIVTGSDKLATNNNAPRLYYKINTGTYSILSSIYLNNDTIKFRIPSQSYGTLVSYYFALQDSLGSICLTLPGGGSGINPPGTTPPSTVFRYDIYSNNNLCSNTLPKPINDLQFTLDTILVNQENKLINRLKLNLTLYHPDDGDLVIQLKGPNGILNLSQGNGSGGANYINTTFDDSATTQIIQGTPPFTGTYNPQNPLSFFNNQPATAPWILRIFDLKTGNTGTLINWCIFFELKNSVSVKEQNIPVKFELSQNYPNPFNPTTNIEFQIPKNSYVSLKVYDVLGKEVATLVNENLKAGEYQAVFNGSGLASGTYFYKLETGNFTEIKKMILIK